MLCANRMRRLEAAMFLFSFSRAGDQDDDEDHVPDGLPLGSCPHRLVVFRNVIKRRERS